MRKVFEMSSQRSAVSNQQSAVSNQQSAISQNNPGTWVKNGFDKTVIRLSNGGLTFVCNKTSIPGWGESFSCDPLPNIAKPTRKWLLANS
jgi:hypothetical protein